MNWNVRIKDKGYRRFHRRAIILLTMAMATSGAVIFLEELAIWLEMTLRFFAVSFTLIGLYYTFWALKFAREYLSQKNNFDVLKIIEESKKNDA